MSRNNPREPLSGSTVMVVGFIGFRVRSWKNPRFYTSNPMQLKYVSSVKAAKPAWYGTGLRVYIGSLVQGI